MTPIPHAPRRGKGLTPSQIVAWLNRPARKRPRRKGGEAEREPVEPHDPKPLSGGAAAELEFDD